MCRRHPAVEFSVRDAGLPFGVRGVEDADADEGRSQRHETGADRRQDEVLCPARNTTQPTTIARGASRPVNPDRRTASVSRLVPSSVPKTDGTWIRIGAAPAIAPAAS
jgi:hypothetical protein